MFQNDPEDQHYDKHHQNRIGNHPKQSSLTEFFKIPYLRNDGAAGVKQYDSSVNLLCSKSYDKRMQMELIDQGTCNRVADHTEYNRHCYGSKKGICFHIDDY